MTATRTNERARTRRAIALAATVTAVLLYGAASALAGELLILGPKSKPDLEYFAAKGERNDVHVSDSKAGYVIQDLGAVIKNSASRCKRSADKHKVTCPHKIRRSGGPTRKPAFLNFVLNDRSDYLIISAAVHLPATISGDSGDDRILSGPSGDTIYGKNGDDYIDGRSGHDTISGGEGDDIIISNDDTRDVVKCGPGTDRVEGDHLDKIASDCERVEA
jgi:Ca2+-binding RTX toxin-like protein